MKKKNLKKLLLAVCCAALLVCVSIGATVAYLTSKGTVTNTFTVGKVKITLDEAKVNLEGVEVNKDGEALVEGEKAPRVTENAYKLLPGHTYTKDPTVHVAADSEACYVFVKVANDVSAIETTETSKTIAGQIAAKGWTSLDGETGVYYKVWNPNDAADLVVFENFTIADTVKVTNLENITTDTKIEITAYAIQKDGFENDVAGAWAAVKGI